MATISYYSILFAYTGSFFATVTLPQPQGHTKVHHWWPGMMGMLEHCHGGGAATL